MTVIVDASVWFLGSGPEDDPRSLAAAEILPLVEQVHELHAPTLIGYELAQIIHVKRPRDTEPRENRQMRLGALLGPLQLQEPDWRRLGELTETLSLSAYDAAYVELAERLDAALLTEDSKMHAAGVKVLGKKRVWSLAEAGKAVKR